MEEKEAYFIVSVSYLCMYRSIACTHVHIAFHLLRLFGGLSVSLLMLIATASHLRLLILVKILICALHLRLIRFVGGTSAFHLSVYVISMYVPILERTHIFILRVTFD